MAETLFPAVALLSDYLDQTRIKWNEQDEKPAKDSPASYELANFPRLETIATAYSQALLLFEASADYCMALVKTLTEPGQSVAPWACARGVLETSALATWLWDANINGTERAQRSLAFRHEGLTQQRKFLKSMKDDAGEKRLIERLKDVEQIALNLDIA